MKKTEMLQEMHMMCNDIMLTLLDEGASIKPDHLDVPEDADTLKMDFIRPAHHWRWISL